MDPLPSALTVALTTLPPGPHSPSSTTAPAKPNYYHRSTDTTLVSVPPATLQPPPDANRRFARFLRAWHISAFDPQGTATNGDPAEPRFLLANTM